MKRKNFPGKVKERRKTALFNLNRHMTTVTHNKQQLFEHDRESNILLKRINSAE